MFFNLQIDSLTDLLIFPPGSLTGRSRVSLLTSLFE
jgi:hypothetical protein